MLAPTPASPESVGMSKAALDRIDAHLKKRYIDAGRFPGTQLLVYRRGKIAHSSMQGFADLERKVPVKLSITHNFCSDQGTQRNVGEA